jgi:Flp pilus assembly protein TadG
LIVPVLALFVFGVLDVARIFHALIAISNAAREGARYGMAYGITRSVGNVYSINETIIDNATIQEAANLGVTLAANQVTPTCQINPDPAGETCGPGVRLRVEVTYNFRPILAIVFPSSGLNLRRNVEMVVP